MVTHPGELRQRRVHLLVAGRDGLTDVCIVPASGAETRGTTQIVTNHHHSVFYWHLLRGLKFETLFHFRVLFQRM